MLAVHLLHECIAIRAQLESAQRLTTFLVNHNQSKPSMGIGVALNVSERAVGEAVGIITGWLNSQVVALHDPLTTTDIVNGDDCPLGDDYD